jgi:hypothetical protein
MPTKSRWHLASQNKIKNRWHDMHNSHPWIFIKQKRYHIYELCVTPLHNKSNVTRDNDKLYFFFQMYAMLHITIRNYNFDKYNSDGRNIAQVIYKVEI